MKVSRRHSLVSRADRRGFCLPNSGIHVMDEQHAPTGFERVVDDFRDRILVSPVEGLSQRNRLEPAEIQGRNVLGSAEDPGDILRPWRCGRSTAEPRRSFWP